MLGAVIPTAQAQTPGTSGVAVIPQPVRVTPHPGQFRLTPRTIIWSDAASAPLADQLVRYLAPATGFTLRVRVSRALPSDGIVLRRDGRLSRLGAEGYLLDVRPSRVVARAPETAGLFYAIQTIRQLLPPEILRDAPIRPPDAAWTMPSVSIEDQPRFAWRGAHLDVGRHFMPVDFIKKYVDLLALHKMNTFHWHLTEDQGWRIEIRKYPNLTKVGAWRKETIVGHPQGDAGKWTFDGLPHGGYYTQDEVREVVAYAKARFITIVPEIEMPGHAVAAIASYPALGVTGAAIPVATSWGVFDDILNAEPATVAFMQDVLSEVLTLFPGTFIHVGGDEAAKTKWAASPAIQARIKALGVGDEHGLQSWFIRQMDAFLTSHGRRLIGWDEILEGGLAPNATVMSWRGVQGGIDAARAGHDVVMAPGTHTYFDHYQSRDTSAEPIAIGGFLPIETVYSYEPVPQELTPAEARHVLGAQGQVWTEYMKDPRKVEYMAYPRMCALAEVVWTPAAMKDYASFRARLTTHLRRLEALDVNFRRPE
jgi:hexosaminidase